MTIDLLPNEIWLKILKKLNPTDIDNLLFVNKRFHSLVFEISSNLVINHDFSLKSDYEILERIRHYKEVFVKCGTNDHISNIVIVNKTKNVNHCPNANDSGNYGDLRKSKLMLINLIPQFRELYLKDVVLQVQVQVRCLGICFNSKAWQKSFD